MNAVFSSARYWEGRYRAGGNSGSGSYGRLAEFKAAFINGFVAANDIGRAIDHGCGDGALLARLDIAEYVGIDVSPTILAACAQRFADRPGWRFLSPAALEDMAPAELAMSIDVIFHLVEDAAYAAYIATLAASATRYLLVYSSNVDLDWPAAHVRHRRFSADLGPRWRLAAHLPNPYAYDPADPDNTSFADFHVFVRDGAGCVVPVMPLPPAPRGAGGRG